VQAEGLVQAITFACVDSKKPTKAGEGDRTLDINLGKVALYR
jgi:hypothetical protein